MNRDHERMEGGSYDPTFRVETYFDGVATTIDELMSRHDAHALALTIRPRPSKAGDEIRVKNEYTGFTADVITYCPVERP